MTTKRGFNRPLIPLQTCDALTIQRKRGKGWVEDQCHCKVGIRSTETWAGFRNLCWRHQRIPETVRLIPPSGPVVDVSPPVAQIHRDYEVVKLRDGTNHIRLRQPEPAQYAVYDRPVENPGAPYRIILNTQGGSRHILAIVGPIPASAISNIDGAQDLHVRAIDQTELDAQLGALFTVKPYESDREVTINGSTWPVHLTVQADGETILSFRSLTEATRFLDALNTLPVAY